MKKSDKVSATIFLSVLMLFFLSIVLRVGTRQILVKRMGINNSFTDIVFFDLDFMKNTDTKDTILIDIDWEAIYPFSQASDTYINNTVAVKPFDSEAINAIKGAVSSIEVKIEQNTTEYLVGYRKLCELAGIFKEIIQWNFTSFFEYNNFLFLEDGYLTNVAAYTDPTEAAESTAELESYCESLGIDFLYVMAPSKICKYEDSNLAGNVDFSNETADDLLRLFENLNVNYIDLREVIHAGDLSHHSLFFRTDHHWKPETGLWAAGEVMSEIAEQFGYSIDLELLDGSRYYSEKYSNWFLGSLGKKVTLSRADPDDISLLYPDFDTRLRYVVPTRGVDLTGDFSVTYDMDCISERDYYNKNPYYAYNYGTTTYSRFENLYNEDGPKVLVFKNSYGDCEVPFMSLVSDELVAVDLRSFNGSVRSLIEDEDPDIVLVMYSAGSTTEIDWDSHLSLYDFR